MARDLFWRSLGSEDLIVGYRISAGSVSGDLLAGCLSSGYAGFGDLLAEHFEHSDCSDYSDYSSPCPLFLDHL